MEEKKINSNLNQVEDVFAEVENNPQPQKGSTDFNQPANNLDISESAISQSKESSEISEPQVYNSEKDLSSKPKTGNFLFYMLLTLIILLGAFAIWALVF